MAASQRNQQEAFQELTRASRDKANDSMFTLDVIPSMEPTDRSLKIGSMKSTRLVEPATEDSGLNYSRNQQEL